MAGETTFAKIKVNGTELKYEGTYGEYADFFSKEGLAPCFPLQSVSFQFHRPFEVGNQATSTTSGLAVPFTHTWVKECPTMAAACFQGEPVDITVFTVNQGKKGTKYIAGITVEMTDGRITDYSIIPGYGGSPSTVNFHYKYKKIEIKDAENVKASFEQQSAGIA